MAYKEVKNEDVEKHLNEEKERLALTVKAIRKKRKLTQAQLAFHCGLTQQVINEIENGKTSPQLFTISKLGLYFDLTYSELFWCGFVKY